MKQLSEYIMQQGILLADSFKKATGQNLTEGILPPEEIARALYEAPFVLLSHDTQPDPIFNYANLTAQQLWEMPWPDFTQLPSRLSAEPVAVAERQAMLAEARQKGYISDYNGVRISSSGRRFIIRKAILWNMYDARGIYQGQAVTFREWEFL